MRLLNHRSPFSTLTLASSFLANKSRNAVRFQSQNLLWDFQELNYQSYAFSKGLHALRFKPNDALLVRLPAAQQSQAYVTRLGAQGANIDVFVSKGITAEQVDKQLTQTKANGIVFEPTLPVGDKLLIDVLNELIPELKNTKNGIQVKSKRYPRLAHLIQTNFYSYPGVYKYRSVLDYSPESYKSIEVPSITPLALPASTLPLLITSPLNSFSFRAAVLNSVGNGRFVVVAEPKDVSRIIETYHGKLEVVAQEDLNVHKQVTVIVEKGKGVMPNHPKRVQI